MLPKQFPSPDFLVEGSKIDDIFPGVSFLLMGQKEQEKAFSWPVQCRWRFISLTSLSIDEWSVKCEVMGSLSFMQSNMLHHIMAHWKRESKLHWNTWKVICLKKKWFRHRLIVFVVDCFSYDCLIWLLRMINWADATPNDCLIWLLRMITWAGAISNC